MTNNDENITPKVFWCKGCEYMVNELFNDYGVPLCDECNDKYDNKTGFCCLDCCLGGRCDESC